MYIHIIRSMYDNLEFVNGLQKNEKDVISWSQVKHMINKPHNLYEITRPKKNVKIFVDIDGKASPNISESDFYDTVNEINEVLSAHENDFVVMGSSKYNHIILKKNKEEKIHKYSWRLTFKDYIECVSYMSSYVKHNIFPKIESILDGIIKITWDKSKNQEFDILDIDPSVYRVGFGKMRTINAYKHPNMYEIDRVNKMVNGELENHLIHCITDDDTFIKIETPIETLKPMIETPKPIIETKTKQSDIPLNQMEDLLLNFLKNETVNWSTYFLIGSTLAHNNYPFELFDNWCKLSKDYNATCSNKTDWASWKRSKDHMCLGGIINHFKITKPDQYQEYKLKYGKSKFYISMDTLEKGESFVCNHIVKYIKTNCVYTQKRFYIYDAKSGLWVMYENLYTKITDTINKCIDGSIFYITKKLKDDLSTEEKDKLRNSIKSLHSYYSKIAKSGYISAIEKSLKNILKNDEFYDMLDSNINVIAFKNGIYDMKKKELREYRATDYITKHLDFDFEEANNDDIKIVKTELLKICNMNQSHMDYYISCLAQSLTGERLKVLYFLIGLTGNNGKSMLLDCLERIFPIYVTKIPNSVISKDSRDKHKFLPKLVGKRCVYIEELDKKKLNENFLKEISGNDKMSYNVMYGCNADIIIRFNMFMISNHSPNLTTDGGIKNRNRVISFESQFPQDQKEDDYENKIFIQDKTLGDKFVGKYRNAIVHILLDYVEDYYINGCTKPIPDEFKEEVELLNNANEDKLSVVINELVCKDAEGKLSKTELIEKYKNSTGFNNINSRDINDKIKLLFGKKYDKTISFGYINGKQCRGGWKGLTLKNDEMDI